MARIVDKDSKRQAILKDAAGCFAASGYDATSMDDVAAAAGISKGSLYDYFKNKEDLFYGVFEWLQQNLLKASAERIVSQTGACDRIAAFADASVATIVDNIGLYPVILEVWSAAAKTGSRERFSRSLQNFYATYRAEVTRLIVDAQRDGDISASTNAPAIAAVMLGAVDGLLLQYWLDRSFDPCAWVKSFMTSLFEGIAAKKRGMR